MTLRMLDSIEIGNLPAGAAAYLGYTGGRWPTYLPLVTKFPHAHVLGLAIAAGDDAQGCDCEHGDLTPEQVPAWVARQAQRGVWRPVVYASAATMPGLLAKLDRGRVRLLSAHYGAGKHICGPRSCGLVPVDCDGTQWADDAPGVAGSKIDESLLADGFFPGTAAKPVMEEPDMVLLGSGRTPVMIPAGTKALHLVSEDKRTVELDWHGGQKETEHLTWDQGPVSVTVPAGISAVVLDVSGVTGHVALSFT